MCTEWAVTMTTMPCVEEANPVVSLGSCHWVPPDRRSPRWLQTAPRRYRLEYRLRDDVTRLAHRWRLTVIRAAFDIDISDGAEEPDSRRGLRDRYRLFLLDYLARP